MLRQKGIAPINILSGTCGQTSLHWAVSLIFIVISVQFLPSFPLFASSFLQMFFCCTSRGTSNHLCAFGFCPVCLYFISSSQSWFVLPMASCLWSQWRPRDLAIGSLSVLFFLLYRAIYACVFQKFQKISCLICSLVMHEKIILHGLVCKGGGY